MVKSVGLMFFKNYSLICSSLAWVCAQMLKIILIYITDKTFKFELLFSSGGMPSAHSAAVTALAISIGRQFGVVSPVFSIAVILAAIVMYDSSGVRRSSGEQAKLLNNLVNFLNLDELEQLELKKNLRNFKKSKVENDELNKEKSTKIVKEQLGHTVIEVFSGAALGVLIVLVVPFKL